MPFLERAAIEILWRNEILTWRLGKGEEDSSLQAYTINLCKMDCRIKQALSFCQCVPFFYAVRNVKVCNITGMLCLSKSSWYDTEECQQDCPSLCETTIMTKVAQKEVISLSMFTHVLKSDKVLNLLLIKRIFPARLELRSHADDWFNIPENNHSTFGHVWLWRLNRWDWQTTT